MSQPKPTNGSDNARDIADGISQGVERSKLHLTDRRLLVLYLLVVAFVVASSYWQNQVSSKTQHAFERSLRTSYDNCKAIQESDTSFNGLIDQQVKNVQNSKAITPQQKAQALAAYGKVLRKPLNCERILNP